MANQEFDLKGWMQQNRQGVYKNALNEHCVDLQPINSLKEESEEDEPEEDEEITHKKAMKFAKKADKEIAKLPKWDQDEEDEDLYEEDEMEEASMFGGSRKEALMILEVLRSDYGVAEGKILDYLVSNYMSGDEALSAMEAAKEEFIGNDEDDEDLYEDEKAKKPTGSHSAGTIEEDEEGEKVTLKTESGIVELGNMHGDGGPIRGEISIYAVDNSPQGYTSVKVSDLKRLIAAFNDAEWSENKI